jgi:hypothetical protein
VGHFGCGKGGKVKRPGDGREAEEGQGNVGAVGIAQRLRLDGIVGAVGAGVGAVGEKGVGVHTPGNTRCPEEEGNGVVGDVIGLGVAPVVDAAPAVIGGNDERGLIRENGTRVDRVEDAPNLGVHKADGIAPTCAAPAGGVAGEVGLRDVNETVAFGEWEIEVVDQSGDLVGDGCA